MALNKTRVATVFEYPRCTKELWKPFLQAIGEDEDRDWYLYNFPDQVVDFADYIASEALREDPIARAVKVLTIDEEFLDYLKANNLEFTRENLEAYTDSLDDEKALALLKKNHMDVQITVLFISAYIEPAEYNVPSTKADLKLSDRNRILLWKYLGQIYGRENVYVPGCILRSYQCANPSIQNTLLQASKRYFDHGNNDRFDEIKTAPYLKARPIDKGYVVYFPFVVRGTVNSSVIISYKEGQAPALAEQLPLYPSKATFLKEHLSRYGLGTPDINHSRFGELIEDDFESGSAIRILPVGLTGDQVFEDEDRHYENM